jgi:hypothetical protein
VFTVQNSVAESIPLSATGGVLGKVVLIAR